MKETMFTMNISQLLFVICMLAFSTSTKVDEKETDILRKRIDEQNKTLKDIISRLHTLESHVQTLLYAEQVLKNEINSCEGQLKEKSIHNNLYMKADCMYYKQNSTPKLK